MKNVQTIAIAAFAAAGLGSTALAGYTVTQTLEPAPQYTDKTVNFDEVGAPTGAGNPWTYYQSINGAVFESGNGGTGVDAYDAMFGINGGSGSIGNSISGGFGVFAHFGKDIDELSFQAWADGPGSGFNVGFVVYLLNDGVEVGSGFFNTLAYGSNALSEKSWYNVVATDGDSFDQVVFYGTSFSSFTTYADNFSWNNVPAPGALALLGLAGVAARRRRRA